MVKINKNIKKQKNKKNTKSRAFKLDGLDS